jgi:hypothetical protein
MSQQLLRDFDGRDNRQTLIYLLEHLGDGVSPADGCKRRRELLRWAAAQTKIIGGPVKVHPQTVGMVHETYMDLVGMTGICGLDINVVAKELERRVRRIQR